MLTALENRSRNCHTECMKDKVPPDLGTSKLVEDFYARERERVLLMKRALGPAAELQEKIDAMKGPLEQWAALQQSGVFSAADQVRQLSADKAYQLMSVSQVSALSETATALSQQNIRISNQLRLLSSSFDSGVFAAARAMQNQTDVLATAMAAAQWQSRWKLLAEQMAPNMSAVRKIAERVMVLDMATLRATANNHIESTTTRWVAEQAIEAQDIVEALAQAETAEDSARLFIAFVSILSAIFNRFKENTVDELRSMGLVSLLTFAFTLMSVQLPQPDAAMSDEEQAAHAEIQEELNAMHKTLGEILDAEYALDESYVSELPRAEILRTANIRRTPERNGPRLAVLESGDAVAIVKREKRWVLIVYRDPLANQLSQGWVYGTLVAQINEAD